MKVILNIGKEMIHQHVHVQNKNTVGGKLTLIEIIQLLRSPFCHLIRGMIFGLSAVLESMLVGSCVEQFQLILKMMLGLQLNAKEAGFMEAGSK